MSHTLIAGISTVGAKMTKYPITNVASFNQSNLAPTIPNTTSLHICQKIGRYRNATPVPSWVDEDIVDLSCIFFSGSSPDVAYNPIAKGTMGMIYDDSSQKSDD